MVPNDEQHRQSSEKTYTITVNTRDKTVSGHKIAFDDVVKLAYDVPPSGEDVIFTVKYRHGRGEPLHTLDMGGSVTVTEGMVFDVGHTNRS